MPSGNRRFFIHSQHRGQRIWKIVGVAAAMTVDKACFEIVAETVFRRYAWVWKPQTQYLNRNYLHRQILPRFAGMQVADITQADVLRWFAARRAPAADCSLLILSVILKEAELPGYSPKGSNPYWEIRRYRRKGRQRFLSDGEIGRLAAVLSTHESGRPLQVAAVRLLLLTGCRKSEVLTLRWSDYRKGRLFLRDGKSGPRTLSSPASHDMLLSGCKSHTGIVNQ